MNKRRKKTDISFGPTTSQLKKLYNEHLMIVKKEEEKSTISYLKSIIKTKKGILNDASKKAISRKHGRKSKVSDKRISIPFIDLTPTNTRKIAGYNVFISENNQYRKRDGCCETIYTPPYDFGNPEAPHTTMGIFDPLSLSWVKPELGKLELGAYARDEEGESTDLIFNHSSSFAYVSVSKPIRAQSYPLRINVLAFINMSADFRQEIMGPKGTKDIVGTEFELSLIATVNSSPNPQVSRNIIHSFMMLESTSIPLIQRITSEDYIVRLSFTINDGPVHSPGYLIVSVGAKALAYANKYGNSYAFVDAEEYYRYTSGARSSYVFVYDEAIYVSMIRITEHTEGCACINTPHIPFPNYLFKM